MGTQGGDGRLQAKDEAAEEARPADTWISDFLPPAREHWVPAVPTPFSEHWPRVCRCAHHVTNAVSPGPRTALRNRHYDPRCWQMRGQRLLRFPAAGTVHGVGLSWAQ